MSVGVVLGSEVMAWGWCAWTRRVQYLGVQRYSRVSWEVRIVEAKVVLVGVQWGIKLGASKLVV